MVRLSDLSAAEREHIMAKESPTFDDAPWVGEQALRFAFPDAAHGLCRITLFPTDRVGAQIHPELPCRPSLAHESLHRRPPV
jgi:hypothetical protein